MLQVWFLFKTLEALIGCICVVYHCLGFQGKEPLPHILIFCGTFFGFTVMSLMGVVALSVGAAPPALTEFSISFLGAFLYFLASFMSMHYAEHDFHLMYLSDFEEPRHPFFAYSRSQSICALAAGSLHLLHAVLALDVMLKPRVLSDSSDETDTESEIDLMPIERRPIRIYFLGKVIETKLRRFKWFDNLCRRSVPTVSLFSLLRHSKSVSSTKFYASKYSMGGDSLRMQANKAFAKSKSKKSMKLNGDVEKNMNLKKNKNQKTASTDTNTETEETVSNVSYSDYHTASKQPSVTIAITEKDERPLKRKASTAPVSEDDNQTRVSFSGSIDGDAKGTTAQFSPPAYTKQKPSILRRELNVKKSASDDRSMASFTSSAVPSSSLSTFVSAQLRPMNGKGSNLAITPSVDLVTDNGQLKPALPHTAASTASDGSTFEQRQNLEGSNEAITPQASKEHIKKPPPPPPAPKS